MIMATCRSYFAIFHRLPLNKFLRFRRTFHQFRSGCSVRANRFVAMDIVDPAIDFLALAASMGLPARRIDRATDIAPTLEAAISSEAAIFLPRPSVSISPTSR
jgi:benzoylformate decarboxylase